MVPFGLHFKAVVFRRFLVVKGAGVSLFRVFIAYVYATAMSISIKYGLKGEDLHPDAVTFKSYTTRDNPVYALVYNSSCQDLVFRKWISNITDILSGFCNGDVGSCQMYHFENRDYFNTWAYDGTQKATLNLLFGLEIHTNVSENYVAVTVLYNETDSDGRDYCFAQLERLLWKKWWNVDLQIRYIQLNNVNQATLDLATPFFAALAFLGVLFLTGEITTDDVHSPRRRYLLDCNLPKFRYWIGTIFVDFLVWTLISLLVWIANVAISQDLFTNHYLYTIWVALFGGFGVLLFAYSLCFVASEGHSGTAIVMLSYMLMVAGVYVGDVFRGTHGDPYVLWVYALLPPVNLYSAFAALTKVDSNLSFGELWKNSDSKPFLICQFVNIVLYGLLLRFCEFLGVYLPKRKNEKEYQRCREVFGRIQSQQTITDEAREAGRIARQSAPGEFAICVRDVYRLFFSTTGAAIPAVNNVSLGVRQGTIFGFLGANGAGKSTLMKMITGEITPSAGVIEVNGIDISKSTLSNISLCPQFNDHIAKEVTVSQHLKIFGWIYGLTERDIQEKTERYIRELELEVHRHKQIRQLSGGNARKVAIAISLMSPASVVLLDEPTSSLDPIVRHKVQDLVKSLKGQKTFMLCTHLLGEAESMCETISIMIRGSIFVIGSPQYLANRFGTDWRLDLLLDDDERETEERVSDYIDDTFPNAKLIMARPKNRVYSIPADSIALPEVFRTLKSGLDDRIGIKFFTCSISTLEKVFLELVAVNEDLE